MKVKYTQVSSYIESMTSNSIREADNRIDLLSERLIASIDPECNLDTINLLIGK